MRKKFHVFIEEKNDKNGHESEFNHFSIFCGLAIKLARFLHI